MGSLQDHNEPVAWCHLQYNEDGTYFADCLQYYPDSYGNTPLYTAPQPAKRPLTDEEIFKMVNPTQYHPSAPEGWVRFGFSRKHLIGFARAIERAHGIGEQE
jgi:hypothetical protein